MEKSRTLNEKDKSRFLSEYKIGATLGKGHFASVKLVTCKKDKLKYACKIIHKKTVGKSNTDVVMKEINILQEVGKHPGCVGMYDFFNDVDSFYIVMEYCGGGDLFSKIIEDGAFSEESARKCMMQLAEAIKHIHSHGVAHRDIKPENILMTDAGDLKLADFGLSKMVDHKQLMKTQCGTWAYCAPEVLLKKAYDLSVDVWSVGVLMYILLCGYHPFDECGDAPEHELQKRIIKVKYDFDDPSWEPISDTAKQIISGAKDGAGDMISGMLIYDPKKRITIDEFLSSTWVRGRASEIVLANVSTGLTKHLQGRAKFRSAVKGVLAANKMRLSATKISTGSSPENSVSRTDSQPAEL